MKKFVILIMVLLSLGACQSGEPIEVVPTLAPTAVLNVSDESSPRETAVPNSNLPPTWTPEPQDAAGHIATLEPTPVVTRVVHVVQRNETLGGIAELYGVSVSAIAEANDIANIDTIEVGQQLVIP